MANLKFVASVANLKRVSCLLLALFVSGFCLILVFLFHSARVSLETVQTTAVPKKEKQYRLLNGKHDGISSSAFQMLTWFSQNNSWRDLEYAAECDTGTFAPMRSPSTGLPMLSAYFCTSFNSATAIWCFLGPCFAGHCASDNVTKALPKTRFICAFNDGMAVMSEPIHAHSNHWQIIVVCKLNSQQNAALYSESQFQQWLNSTSARILGSDTHTAVGVRLVDAREWTVGKQTPDAYMSGTVPVCATLGINHGIDGVPQFLRSDWPKGTPKPAPKHLVGGCAIVHPSADKRGAAHILAGQWLHYHTTVAQLEHVYLYHHWCVEEEVHGNYTEGHKAIVDAAQRHISQIGNATYIRWKVRHNPKCGRRPRCWQYSQYHSCARHFRFQTRYFIIFDVDEFVVANANAQLTSAQFTAASIQERASVRAVVSRMVAKKRNFGYATIQRFLGDVKSNYSGVNEIETISATFLERHPRLCLVQPMQKYIIEGRSMIQMKTHEAFSSKAAFGGFRRFKTDWRKTVGSSALIILHTSDHQFCDGNRSNVTTDALGFMQNTTQLFKDGWQKYVASNAVLSLSKIP